MMRMGICFKELIIKFLIPFFVLICAIEMAGCSLTSTTQVAETEETSAEEDSLEVPEQKAITWKEQYDLGMRYLEEGTKEM